MIHQFSTNILGLNVNDKNLLLRKFNLIKDKLFPNLNMKYNIGNSSNNWIKLEYKGSEDEVMELYHLISNIKFNRTHMDYEDDKIPYFNCSIQLINGDYGGSK